MKTGRKIKLHSFVPEERLYPNIETYRERERAKRKYSDNRKQNKLVFK